MRSDFKSNAVAIARHPERRAPALPVANAGPRRAGTPRSNRGERGAVLVIVLWIALGLVSITLYFANSMSYELRAADNRVSGLATDQAIDGAARYVAYALANLATPGSMPDPIQFKCEAVEVGGAHFWLIGRDTNDPPTHSDMVSFGLIDEASKLNLNRASQAMLEWLPGISLDVAANIYTWRSSPTNLSSSATGVTSESYERLSPPYVGKGAPFDTADELRLVYGTDLEMLNGEDLNHNGILDPNEVDLNRNGRADPGLLDCVTVYSREPNKRSDGTAPINIANGTWKPDLTSMLTTNLASGRAADVMRRLTGATYPNPLAFYAASGMTREEFEGVADQITFSAGDFVQGRINVNTASAAVIGCIPGLTNYAQTLVTFRASNPDKLGSVAWVLEALGVTGQDATTLAGLIGNRLTTRSYQFTADVAAIGPYGRGYRRVRFVFDTSTGTPKIIYRQDLSYLGWALGKQVRETWLAKNQS